MPLMYKNYMDLYSIKRTSSQIFSYIIKKWKLLYPPFNDKLMSREELAIIENRILEKNLAAKKKAEKRAKNIAVSAMTMTIMMMIIMMAITKKWGNNVIKQWCGILRLSHLLIFKGEKVIVSVHELTHYWTKPQSRAQKPSCSKSRVFHLKKTELERGGWQGIWVALESVMMHRIQTWRRRRRWQWMPNFILAETFCQIYIFVIFI